ncbi:rubrerythrin [Paenibacillus taihuensis]|uniref:Rubrerythrin n=2 Tax=Paenibacillus taihuensis TaxID=1156355 RepID=A0A3D9SC77_9BACL|nr:rubrerythrin [Paenibacillus taihuensis]
MGGQMGMQGGMAFTNMFLIPDISRAIIGEVHAYQFYQRLAELAPNEQDRQTILRIQRDEAKHYRWFSTILSNLGGQQPQIPAGELPISFRDGVRTAINHELETAAFYQDVAYRATDRPIEMHFTHAMHDEQRHASLFQLMLSSL